MINRLFIVIFPILMMLFIGCNNSDNSPNFPQVDIDLNEAKLTDFPFKEIDYLNIEITQPVIDNNEEKKEGEIIITLPHTVSSLALTLKSINIDTDKYEIFPSLGVQTLFSETEFVTYKISSASNPEKSIHYKVKIVIAPDPQEEALLISNFELLTKDKASYTDIDLTKKATALQSVDSLLICLLPLPGDYSNLCPAITFKGSKVEYRVNNGSFEEYPVSTGKNIDFKYPNTVDFKISNSKNSVVYRIIVDTHHPIVFEKHTITVPDLQMGSTYNGVGVATWTNKGNYPITTMSPNEYSQVITPAAGLDNIFVTTLSKNGGGNINPDESGTVNIVITNPPLAGKYESLAVFKLRFNENSWKITNSPTDNYISDITYKNAQLKVKGTVTN